MIRHRLLLIGDITWDRVRGGEGPFGQTAMADGGHGHTSDFDEKEGKGCYSAIVSVANPSTSQLLDNTAA